MFIYVYFKFEEFFNFLSKHVYTYDIMICLLSFLNIYIYISSLKSFLEFYLIKTMYLHRICS